MAEGKKIVKCVPNFATNDDKVRERIITAIREVSGCEVLDATSNQTNRTFCTFIGPPKGVLDAALAAAEVAHECIDMSAHAGKHPRIGAMDVCPFVPLWNVNLEECVELAKDFGTRLADKLKVPVYFYEDAQDQPHRKTIRQNREGEYEDLPRKLKDKRWKPDRGPSKFNPRWGATITGARKLLVTFNVNLLASKEHARIIADAIHSDKGKLRSVNAMGWYLDDQDMAQVCTSLTDLEEASIHDVFEECCKKAKELDLAIVGSEVHGLVPLDAMLKAAEFYIEKDSLFALHKAQKVLLAIDRLRLSALSSFNPDDKILEYKLKLLNEDGQWLKCDVRQFVESVARWDPTPSAGGVTAHIASLGVALGTMVGLMTFGKERFIQNDKAVRKAIEPLHSTMQKLMPLTDKDTEAVAAYVDVQRKKSQPAPGDDEKIVQALKAVCDVPLEVMERASSCWEHMETIATCGNPNLIINAEVGARSMDAAIQSAASIVRWNLRRIGDKDRDYCTRNTKRVNDLAALSTEKLKTILDLVAQNEAEHMPGQ